MDQRLCIRCREPVQNRRSYSWPSREAGYIDISQIIIQELLDRELPPTDVICRPCWQRAERTYQRQQREILEAAERDNEVERPNEVPEPSNDDRVSTLMLPGYVRTPNTGRSCVFQHCENESRRRIPENFLLKYLIGYNLLICEDNRVCQEHLEGNTWHELAVQDNLIHNFSADHIVRALSLMRMHINMNVLDFENYETMDAKELYTWTGRTHDQFADILTNTPSLNNNRKKKSIIAASLVKLRTGESNLRLSVIFKTSETTFSRMLKTALNALLGDFVPLHLGYQHILREDAIRRNLTIPERLFGNPDAPLERRRLIAILDGTYIYIQKSSNYFFQRDSYSNHKYRNLVKPFLIVCCDGYILDVSGPHSARTSDAKIMNDILENENEDGDGLFNWYFWNDDVLILDRGFRDAVPNLIARGYNIQMPETKHPHETQLTTEQANKSRFVTICRWVVEVINGRFKRDFRLLRNISRSIPC